MTNQPANQPTNQPTKPPLYDFYQGIMMEPLMSSRYHLAVAGNHEMTQKLGGVPRSHCCGDVCPQLYLCR